MRMMQPLKHSSCLLDPDPALASLHPFETPFLRDLAVAEVDRKSTGRLPGPDVKRTALRSGLLVERRSCQVRY
jgi:hypothetical protein